MQHYCESCALSDHMALLQVDCTPPGNLVIRVLQYRAASGGYLKLTPLQTAGVGAVSKIEYKQSGADVREL